MAVKAESKSEEIGLMCIGPEAIVGEIDKFVAFEIENSERLLFSGRICRRSRYEAARQIFCPVKERRWWEGY